jgi:hypothetical protein
MKIVTDLFLHKYYQCNKRKDDGMGETVDRHERRTHVYRNLVGEN